MTDTDTNAADTDGDQNDKIRVLAAQALSTPPSGATPLEVRKTMDEPLEAHARFWIIDDGWHPRDEIYAPNGFYVLVQVTFEGELWKCMCGTVRWDVDFDGGRESSAYLSELVDPAKLEIEVKGCEQQTYFDFVFVDADQAQKLLGSRTEADYRVSGRARMYDPCGNRTPVFGAAELGLVSLFS